MSRICDNGPQRVNIIINIINIIINIINIINIIIINIIIIIIDIIITGFCKSYIIISINLQYNTIEGK